MRVMLTSNVLMPDIAAAIGHTIPNTSGSWMTPLIREMRSQAPEIQMGVLIYAAGLNLKEPIIKDVNGVRYYLTSWGKIGRRLGVSGGLRTQIREALDDFDPDLVNVWGTETPFAQQVTREAQTRNSKTLVCIQGIASTCGKAAFGGLSFAEILKYRTFKEWLTCSGMLERGLHMKLRGKNEMKLIPSLSHVVFQGRWTESQVAAINPTAHRYFTDRLIRDAFWNAHWSLDRCNRHTIFAPSGAGPAKGVHHTICALPLIRQKFPDVSLRIAGLSASDLASGKQGYFCYLKHLIKKHQLEKHVIALGPLSAEEMSKECENAHVFVHASAIESYCVAFAEAMLVGLPACCSYVGGMPGLAVDCEEAVFHSFGDYQMLAHQISEVFADETYAASLSKNAKKRARKRHVAKRIIDNFIDSYRDSIGH